MRLSAATTSLSAGLLLLAERARAYIPAVPTNDTSSLDNSEDLLHLAFSAGVYNAKISRQLWQESFDDDGNYSNVSSVVPWTKYNKGVLIHFDESLRTQPPASVPWIAMISCDTNGTSFSDTDDIFTICRDLGAQAALLYSLGSQGCQITNEYLTSFEKVLDVFATTTLQAARIIEQQFVNVNSAAYQYDSATLNNSATIIQTLLDSNALSVNGNVPIDSTSSTDLAGLASTVNPTLMTVDGAVSSSPTSPSVFDPDSNSSDGGESATPSPTAPSLFSNFAPAPDRFLHRRQQATPSSTSTESSLAGSATRSSVVPSATSTARGTTNYLGAVMAAGNLTVGGLLSSSPSPSASSGGGGDGGRSTGLAMIILYAITGVVCLLFLIVILSGAIRALRNPERYGPRAVNGAHGAGGLGGGGQTRAAGLTRAILDTFPVVRFGGDGAAARRDGAAADEEAGVAGAGVGGTAKDAVEGEEVELATLPTAPAVPLVAPVVRRRSTGADDEEIEAVGSGAGGAGRRRSTSRSSFGRESFHSAVEQPLNRQASVASLSQHAAAPQHVFTSSDDASSPSSSSPASSPLSPPSPPRSPTHLPTTSSSLPPPVPAAVATTGTGAGAGAGEEEEGESCPICFTEFEAGDELRVLPCDQRHIFHTGCIDPWLLEVSSSCPLCRLDLASTSNPSTTAPPTSSDPPTSPTTAETDATAARHEEERVIRHLRALLHRGAQVASAAGAASGMGGGAVGVPPGSGLVIRPDGTAGAAPGPAGQGEDEGQARLRGRFARYVAQRRERVRVAGVGVGVGRRRRNTTTATAGSEAEGVPA